jgi:putative DNA primase/helicase
LIKAKRGLYQRGNKIVVFGNMPAKAADGADIVTLQIFERGDHALVEDLAAAANFEKFNTRAKDWVAADPPMTIVKTLQQRTGRLRFPVLRGVVTAPTMRADGSILSAAGYDKRTGLFFEPGDVEFPPIPDLPTRRDAERALETLWYLFKDFPFEAAPDRAVAMSAILTACVRPSLPAAPMHAVDAPVAGSGKGKIVDIATVIATGERAAVMAQGECEVELEKRLGSKLMAGEAVIAIDNCTQPLGGDFPCQMLTQETVSPRILGLSKTPNLSASAFVAANGNNLLIEGDLTRRAVMCKVDPKMEQPENRRFDSDPVEEAKARRPEFVVAALTVLRAFHVAGRPGKPVPIGSFEAWSDLVRAALMWLDMADPVESMNRLRKADPVLVAVRAVMSHWRTVIGLESVTAAEVIKRAIEMRPTEGHPEFVNADFRDSLLAVAGKSGSLDSVKLSKWLKSKEGRIVNGASFEQMGSRKEIVLWALRQIT